MNGRLQGQSGWCQQIVSGLRTGRSRRTAGLRMTAMIDVIFLLLTFFVLTARFREPEGFLEMNVPGVRTDASVLAAVTEPMILEILPAENGCRMRFADGQAIEIDRQQPESGLAMAAAAFLSVCQDQHRRPGDALELYCDDAVSWDLLVKIYDVLHALGAEQITLGTIQER